jgi:hypothetical protein
MNEIIASFDRGVRLDLSKWVGADVAGFAASKRTDVRAFLEFG